jgi:salicylate hydroxylase
METTGGNKTFIIVGAGVAGLALSYCIKKFRIPIECIVFERDENRHIRKQGYSLTIQQTISFFDEIGLKEEFEALVFHFTKSYTTAIWNGNVIREHEFQKHVTVPRKSLRDLFLDNAEKLGVEIRWDHQLLEFQQIHNLVSAKFKNKQKIEEVTGSAIIGCEGFHSVVRQKIVHDLAVYLGVLLVVGISPIPPYGGEFQVSKEGGARVFSKPFSQTETMWQLTITWPESKIVPTMEELKLMCLGWTEGWKFDIPQLISSTDVRDMRTHLLNDRNPLNSVLPMEFLGTLMGDSAHPMSPFKGQGVNSALEDVRYLTKVLRESQEPLTSCFREYEKEMIKRTKPFVIGSRKNVFKFHSLEKG